MSATPSEPIFTGSFSSTWASPGRRRRPSTRPSPARWARCGPAGSRSGSASRAPAPEAPEIEIGEPEDVPELLVEIDVPEDASDEDVIALVGELVLHADDLHRTMGGHGLKVERLEVHQDAGVPGGARG